MLLGTEIGWQNEKNKIDNILLWIIEKQVDNVNQHNASWVLVWSKIYAYKLEQF